MPTTLRDLFNELRWRSDDLASVEVVVRHRGAPGDERRIEGEAVVEVLPGGLTVTSDGGEPAFIPYHRVLRVVRGDHLLWRRESP